MKLPPSPPRMSRKQVEAMGLFVTWWAHLEEQLNMMISAFICKDTIMGLGVAANFDYRQKRDVLGAFASLSKEPAKEELTKFIAEVDRLNGMRNLICHCTWGNGRKKGSFKPFVMKAKGKFVFRGHTHNEPNYTVEQIVNEINKIIELINRGEEYFISRKEFVEKLEKEGEEKKMRLISEAVEPVAQHQHQRHKSRPNNRARLPKSDKSQSPPPKAPG